MEAGWKILVRDQRIFIRTEIAGKYAEGFAGDDG
jgi:hypothetical protein